MSVQTETASRKQPRASLTSKKKLSADSIREAAKDIFVKYGYLETSLGVVAKKMKVTRQAIYHYFPAKHDILIDIINIYFDRLEETVRNHSGSEPTGEHFDAMLTAYCEFVMEHRAEAMLIARELAHLPAAEQKRARQRRRRINDAFVEEYTAGQAAGLYKAGSAKLLVALILGTANWTTRWYQKDGPLKAATVAATAQDLLADGYKNKETRGRPERGAAKQNRRTSNSVARPGRG